MTARRRDIDAQASIIAEAYRQGETSKTLCVRFGCSTSKIDNVLREHGIKHRSRRDAQLVKNARPGQREKNLAWGRQMADARIGKPVGDATMRRRAAAKQVSQSEVGEFEDALAAALRARGLDVAQQIAFDRYNIDLAIGAMAIEIHKARHHPGVRAKVIKRVKCLLNGGWHVVYVWHYPGSWGGVFDYRVVADQIVTLLNRFGSDPSAPRQYAVIGSDGYDPSTRRVKRQKWAGMRPPSRVADPEPSYSGIAGDA